VRRLLLALTSALLVLVSPATASAHPDEGQHGHRAPVYLAMGDSIAAGQESAPRTTDFLTTVAAWKANGYAAQFADMLVRDREDCRRDATDRGRHSCRRLQYLNIARTAIPAGVPGLDPAPGVTTALLIEEQLPVATELLRARNGDANPRNDVEVVTLTVGGNDVFSPVISACVPPTPQCPTTVTEVLRAFAVNYDRILNELRAAAGPDAVIETMTYYNPLPFCERAGAAPLGDVVLEGFPVDVEGTVVLGLNGVIRLLSSRHDAIVADTYGALQSPAEFVGGQDCLHPTRLGHTTIAGVFGRAFRAAED